MPLMVLINFETGEERNRREMSIEEIDRSNAFLRLTPFIWRDAVEMGKKKEPNGGLTLIEKQKLGGDVWCGVTELANLKVKARNQIRLRRMDAVTEVKK